MAKEIRIQGKPIKTTVKKLLEKSLSKKENK